MTALKKNILLALIVLGIAGSIWYFERQRAGTGSPEATDMLLTDSARGGPVAKEIASPAGFINTEPFTLANLVGKKIILVDFWTYSCINCQRTLPYLNAWHEKYKDSGLAIVGVHTPEFEFEKEYDNVHAAVQKFGVQYPVVLDNDYATWRAYGNRYWPRKYLIDIDGYIAYDHIGEGGYEETEKKIQELLAERMVRLGEQGSIASDTTRPADAEYVDTTMPRTPELYFGSARNDSLGEYVRLTGTWDTTPEYAENNTAGAVIALHYGAQKVFFVAGADTPVTIRVRKDGISIKTLTIQQEGLYRLVEDETYGTHTLEIEVEGPGLRAFTFTFG